MSDSQGVIGGGWSLSCQVDPSECDARQKASSAGEVDHEHQVLDHLRPRRLAGELVTQGKVSGDEEGTEEYGERVRAGVRALSRVRLSNSGSPPES